MKPKRNQLAKKVEPEAPHKLLREQGCAACGKPQGCDHGIAEYMGAKPYTRQVAQ